jgi:tetratricopeptide (TPR) repeat protein
MPYTEDNHHLIEAYFGNELSESQKQAFEDKYANDEVFAKQVAFYKIAEHSANEINKETVIGKIKRNNRRRNFFIVSFLVLLVSLLIWIVVSNLDSSSKELPIFVDNNIETTIDKSVLLGKKGKIDWQKVAFQTDNQEMKLNLQTGIDAYYNKEYTIAIQTLSELTAELSMATFYRGGAYFQLKEYEKALQDFADTEEQTLDNLDLIFEARWFAALTFIQTKQTDLAIEKLELLEASDKYKGEAKALIEELTQ